MRTVLIRSVMNVTLKGLGQMLKTEPDPGAIIAALEEGEFPYESPLWGGESSYVEPRHRFVVLPPVTATDLKNLRDAAKERHCGLTLTTADTVAAGCCIVALSFFPVTKRDEVLPPLYAHATEAPTRKEFPTFPLRQTGNGRAEVQAKVM
ncbi:MAG: hypothetical protein HY268_05390 [Deltaproteobacteria bacterium]|nr:hypothetical protein [Deltaproteobacteria bacterium]